MEIFEGKIRIDEIHRKCFIERGGNTHEMRELHNGDYIEIMNNEGDWISGEIRSEEIPAPDPIQGKGSGKQTRILWQFAGPKGVIDLQRETKARPVIR